MAIAKKIGVEKFEEIHHFLRDHNIFIWSLGDLETYYTGLAKKVVGSKDTRALNLSYIIKESGTKIEDYLLNLNEINELRNKVLEK